MKKTGLILTSIFTSIADRTIDLVWLYLALNQPMVYSASLILITLGVSRILIYFFAKKLFETINFYGNYIVGFSCAFVIVIIITKFDPVISLFPVLILKEAYNVFRIRGNDLGLKQIEKHKVYTSGFLNASAFLSFPISFLIVGYLISSGNTGDVYAVFEILIGIATIITYKFYSKNYAKKSTVAVIAQENSQKIKYLFMGINAFIYICIIALWIYLNGQYIYIATIFSLLGMGLVFIRYKFTKSIVYTEHEGIILNSALLILLGIVRYFN